jgi:hypothetical protein
MLRNSALSASKWLRYFTVFFVGFVLFFKLLRVVFPKMPEWTALFARAEEIVQQGFCAFFFLFFFFSFRLISSSFSSIEPPRVELIPENALPEHQSRFLLALNGQNALNGLNSNNEEEVFAVKPEEFGGRSHAKQTVVSGRPSAQQPSAQQQDKVKHRLDGTSWRSAIVAALSVLDNKLIGRQQEARVGLLAMFAKQHVVFLGPPGWVLR